MKQKTIVIQDDDLGELTITVQRADMDTTIRRDLIGQEISAVTDDDPVRQQARQLALYPNLKAATVEATVEGKPLPFGFDDFIGLPYDVLSQWHAAVLDINPSWRPPMPAAEKKA
jgi:hypothetical protein